MIRPRELFDLKWLDNHPWLSPDFHLYSTLPWNLNKKPSTLELIRVITTLPTEWHTSSHVGQAYCCYCCSVSRHIYLLVDAGIVLIIKADHFGYNLNTIVELCVLLFIIWTCFFAIHLPPCDLMNDCTSSTSKAKKRTSCCCHLSPFRGSNFSWFLSWGMTLHFIPTSVPFIHVDMCFSKFNLNVFQSSLGIAKWFT